MLKKTKIIDILRNYLKNSLEGGISIVPFAIYKTDSEEDKLLNKGTFKILSTITRKTTNYPVFLLQENDKQIIYAVKTNVIQQIINDYDNGRID